MLLQWTDALSVGNPDIDLQHQTLINKVNEMHDASMQGKGSDVLAEMVNFLADYALRHFTFEEMYFNTYSWPESAAHLQMHEAFKAKVAEVKQKIAAEGVSATLVIEISRFVSDWLFNHIKVADHAYADYIASKA